MGMLLKTGGKFLLKDERNFEKRVKEINASERRWRMAHGLQTSDDGLSSRGERPATKKKRLGQDVSVERNCFSGFFCHPLCKRRRILPPPQRKTSSHD